MTIRLLLVFVIACAVPAAPGPSTPAPTVAFVASAALPPPAAHGIDRLRAAFTARGIHVLETTAQKHVAADIYVLLGIDVTGGCPQSLSIAHTTYAGRPALDLRGGDGTGLMYAALDTATHIAWGAGADVLAAVRQTKERPFLAERGVSMDTKQ